MNRLKRPVPTCPRCGSRETIRIVLGQPRPDLPIRSQPRITIFSRLGLGVDNPDRVCKRCGLQWRTR